MKFLSCEVILSDYCCDISTVREYGTYQLLTKIVRIPSHMRKYVTCPVYTQSNFCE